MTNSNLTIINVKQLLGILPKEDLVIVRFGLSWFEENEFLKGILQSIH